MNGPINGDVTWTPAGNPYWVEGIVDLTVGSTLHVENGVWVYFNRTSLLNVKGSLEALGTETNRVLFLPNTTQPGPADVVNIRVEGSFRARNATFDYASLRGSGAQSVDLERIRYLHGDTIQMKSVGAVSIASSDLQFEPLDGVSIWDSTSVDISLNEIRVSTLPPAFTDDALWIRRSPDARIVSNMITGRFITGARIESDRALVTGNEISGSAGGITVSGFPASSASGVVLAGNRLMGNRVGIDMTSTVGGTIRDNLVAGSAGSAIYLDSTQYVNVTANELVSNKIGIRLTDSSNATVTRNAVRGNGQGFFVRGGGPHRIFHNWILANAVQAFDSSGGTMWDGAYPSGGNHWSDYAGDDVYRGPNQDIPGADGIGDTPRPVGPSGVDRYPFYAVPAPDAPRNLTARAVGRDVVLSWEPVPTADDYLLSTADTPTGFDLDSPASLGNVTSWTDAGAAESPGSRYYTLRARNAGWDRNGPTSNTAGKWTQEFTSRVATLSLPLHPYPWVDYSQPGWVDVVGELLAATGGARLDYMDAGRWRSVPGDGDPDRPARVGEGYAVEMPSRVTFTGLPGATIDYASWPPYPLAGFDPATTARSITASIRGDDVLLTWAEIPGFGSPGAAYEVYFADAPWKLHGRPWTDYRLLATIPATGAGSASTVHAGALAAGPQWFYRAVPVQDGLSRGASTYSAGVFATSVGPGYSAIGLPLRPVADGAYYVPPVSSLLGQNVSGVLWFDLARQDWVAHAAWMSPGTYDAPFTMTMGVQVDVAVPTRITFVGV